MLTTVAVLIAKLCNGKMYKLQHSGLVVNNAVSHIVRNIKEIIYSVTFQNLLYNIYLSPLLQKWPFS